MEQIEFGVRKGWQPLQYEFKYQLICPSWMEIFLKNSELTHAWGGRYYGLFNNHELRIRAVTGFIRFEDMLGFYLYLMREIRNERADSVC